MQRFVNLKVGRKLFLAFGAVVAVMLTTSILIYQRLGFIQQTTASSTHTYDVLDQLHGIVTGMVDRETGLRGYLVSGDDKFLEPYRGGEAEFKTAFDRAKDLTSDSPKDQARLADIAALADSWRRDVAEKEIALMAKPDTVERAVVMEASGAGKAATDGIRAKVAEMADEEATLLKNRSVSQAAAFDASRTTIYTGGIVSVFLAGLLYWLLNSSVARVIVALTGAMTRLAQGDTGTEIPSHGRRDEIGVMAQAVGVFKDNMVEADQLRSAQEEMKSKAEAEKQTAMGKMADDFEASVKDIVNAVSSSAVRLQNSARDMTRTAEEATDGAATVAAASEQASVNVQTVASASEQLSSSISEIGRQVTESARVCTNAVTDAAQARQSVQEMADMAQKISAVVTLINSIAGQTNLLALNATIEAARAGDAGKGFAVVASEVKSLANQTAKATDDIAAQIRAVQVASTASVEAIQSISATIGVIDEIAASIASAVEEQGAATREIARNVQQAAIGTSEVSSNITGVSQAASGTGAAAGLVLGAAEELSKQSEALSGQVDKFLATIRTA